MFLKTAVKYLGTYLGQVKFDVRRLDLGTIRSLSLLFYPTHTHTLTHILSLSLPSINLPLRLVRFNFVSHVLLSGRDLRGFRTLLTFQELLTIYPGVLTIVSLKARLNFLFTALAL